MISSDSPFNDTDWFGRDDDVRWQWSGATWTTEGCPQGERGGVHQFGFPLKGNANFAWVQHFIRHFAPQGMAAYNGLEANTATYGSHTFENSIQYAA